MKEIPLTKGFVALVDDDDYAAAAKYKWTAQVSKGRSGAYAYRKSYGEPGPLRHVFLHRFLMNPPAGMFVDHIDGDKLNCCRSNMRLCTCTENSRNRGPRVNNTSGFKGVYWNKEKKLWQAQITANRKTRQIGRFASAIEAAQAYDREAVKLHGEFAWLNFPNELRVRAEIEAAGGKYHVIEIVHALYSVLGVI